MLFWSADFGSDRVGSPCGSSSSGTAISGRVALVDGSTGSPEGPAWAGAIIVAVSAATISSAERNEANIETVKSAVNHPNARAYTSRILAEAPVAIPRLALAFLAINAQECPPLLLLAGWLTAPDWGSTRRGRFSD